MSQAKIVVRSGRMSQEHLVDLPKPAKELVVGTEFETEVEGRVRKFNVEISGDGTIDKPLHVA